MKNVKPLTKRNKQIIVLNCALAIFSVVMASLAHVAADGPPLLLIVLWLSGMLCYTGINYLEQQIYLTRKHMAVRNVAVLAIIVSGLGFMTS